MRFIGYNFVPILLILLAGYMVHLNRDGWYWCIIAALILAVFPSGADEKKEK